MKINKERLNSTAKPLSSQKKTAMRKRRENRHMYTASAAIVAKILRQMRISGKTKAQLARDLGVSAANITRYLSGRCNFELRTIVEIERVLDITIIDRNVIPVKKRNQVIIINIDPSKNRSDNFIAPKEKSVGLYNLA